MHFSVENPLKAIAFCVCLQVRVGFIYIYIYKCVCVYIYICFQYVLGDCIALVYVMLNSCINNLCILVYV